MTQLTKEERQMISDWDSVTAMKDAKAIIDRLSARVEELEKEITHHRCACRFENNNLIEMCHFHTETNKQNLSSLLSAVEPFIKVDEAHWDKDMGMCPTWREDIKPSDLHNLSTIAVGIRGKG